MAASVRRGPAEAGGQSEAFDSKRNQSPPAVWFLPEGPREPQNREPRLRDGTTSLAEAP